MPRPTTNRPNDAGSKQNPTDLRSLPTAVMSQVGTGARHPFRGTSTLRHMLKELPATNGKAPMHKFSQTATLFEEELTADSQRKFHGSWAANSPSKLLNPHQSIQEYQDEE